MDRIHFRAFVKPNKDSSRLPATKDRRVARRINFTVRACPAQILAGLLTVRACREQLRLFSATIAFFLLISGCGYTRQTVLPQNIRKIYVETVQNAIPIENVYAYQPGLEISITNAIIRRLNRDSTVKVVSKEDADAVLESRLTAFQQDGLRFNTLESVSEYRLFIVMAMRLRNPKTGKVIWEEPNFSGAAEYFVSQVRSISRDEAAQRAVDRLARNVVDRITEDW